jgi:hypothetical protein
MEKDKENFIKTLKERGVTCDILKDRIDCEMENARTFREMGFMNMANTEEEIADKLRKLKDEVCLLK